MCFFIENYDKNTNFTLVKYTEYMSENPENNTSLGEDIKDESKIKIILDSNDINGFGLQFGVFIISWIVLGNLANYMAKVDFGLSFLLISAIWFLFLVYKIATIRANVYEQIIEDLEKDMDKLKKTNRLLNNMLKSRSSKKTQ